MKHWGIDLTKYIQDLYEENYTTVIEEIKEQNKWEMILLMNRKKYFQDVISS